MTTLKTIIEAVVQIIYSLEPILITLAFLVFFWGLSKFILSSGNEAEVKQGKSFMLWGLLALFILLTYMSIINLTSGDLLLGGASRSNLPYLPQSQ